MSDRTGLHNVGIVDSKVCTKCGKQKPLSDFSIMRSSSDGHYPSCKLCKAAQMRARRAENPAQVRVVAQAYRDLNREKLRGREREKRAADPEPYRKRDRERYRRDRDKRRAASKARYERKRAEILTSEAAKRRDRSADPAYRECVNAASRRWRARNPEKARALQRRQMLKLTDAGGAYTSEVLVHDPCCYCGAPMQEVDHIVGRARGGNGEWDNLTAACQFCNRSKGGSNLLAFLLRRLAHCTADTRLAA